MVFCNCPYCEFGVRFRRARLHAEGCRELGLSVENQLELFDRLFADERLRKELFKLNPLKAVVILRMAKKARELSNK